jgi:hypothetical protein
LENLRELQVVGRLILKCILGKVGKEDMDLIFLTYNSIQLLALVSTVMNVWVQQKAGNLPTSAQEEMCSVKLLFP